MSNIGHPRFSDAEMDRRHAAARALMAERGLDALLIFGHAANRRHYQADVHYFAEVALFHESFLLLPLHGEPVLWSTAHNHHQNALELSRIADTRDAPRVPGPGATIAAELKLRGLDRARIGLVGSFFYTEIDAIRATLPDLALSNLTGTVKRLRSRKSAEELAYQRKAAAGCDAVIAALRDAIRPGVEERELHVVAEAAAWASGCEPTFLYLNSTATANSDSCVPNQLWSRRRIEPGDVINTELTVNYSMYCSQILRPFFVGEPTPEYERIYALTKSVYDQLRDAIKAGTTLGTLYEIGLEIGKAGMTTVDGLAHGFGVDLLPPRVPHMLKRPEHMDEALEANTTLVIQPNPVTPDKKSGMQLGDMGLVTADGFEIMHNDPAEVSRL
jgi:Xaa-Pro dipeptidase